MHLCVHLLPLLVYACLLFDYGILVVPPLYTYACSVAYPQQIAAIFHESVFMNGFNTMLVVLLT